jgi:hypothetical protein
VVDYALIFLLGVPLLGVAGALCLHRGDAAPRPLTLHDVVRADVTYVNDVRRLVMSGSGQPQTYTLTDASSLAHLERMLNALPPFRPSPASEHFPRVALQQLAVLLIAAIIAILVIRALKVVVVEYALILASIAMLITMALKLMQPQIVNTLPNFSGGPPDYPAASLWLRTSSGQRFGFDLNGLYGLVTTDSGVTASAGYPTPCWASWAGGLRSARHLLRGCRQ